MSVVAKMQCHGNQGEASLEKDTNATITLGAVYEGSSEKQAASENAIFGKYTPWGEVKMGIKNPAAAAFFTPWKKYYITFTEAPD